VSKGKIWKSAAGVVLIGIPVLAWNLLDRDKAGPLPHADLWVDMEEKSAMDIMSAQLRDFVITEVDFQDRPFRECMKELEEICGRHLAGEGPVKFRFAEGIDMDVSISANLKNVPVIEAIRFTARKNDCYYRWVEQGVLDFAPRSQRLKKGAGVFEAGNHVFPAAQGSGPVDVKKDLETVGIEFDARDVANYYPKRRLLWASATYDSMDTIGDYCSGMNVLKPPGFFERVQNRVRETLEKMSTF